VGREYNTPEPQFFLQITTIIDRDEQKNTAGSTGNDDQSTDQLGTTALGNWWTSDVRMTSLKNAFSLYVRSEANSLFLNGNAIAINARFLRRSRPRRRFRDYAFYIPLARAERIVRWPLRALYSFQ